MSKIDIVSFWNSSGNIGMAPYVNTSADGGHIDYEGVYSKVDLNTRMQTIVSALPDFFESYRIILTDVNLSGVLVSKAECVLKASSSSDVPDYTQVLTDINTNLTNLNSNFLFKVSDSEQYRFVEVLIKIFNCLSTTYIGNSNTLIRQNSVVSNLQNISNKLTASNYSIAQIMLSSIGSTLGAILSALKLTSNPTASITDVISALNTTIDSKQNTTVVNNEVTPLAEINIDVPFEVKNLKKSDVENL